MVATCSQEVVGAGRGGWKFVKELSNSHVYVSAAPGAFSILPEDLSRALRLVARRFGWLCNPGSPVGHTTRLMNCWLNLPLNSTTYRLGQQGGSTGYTPKASRRSSLAGQSS